MRVLFLFSLIFLLARFTWAAPHSKKIPKYQPLSHEELVAKGWRPTPTTSERVKKGRFQGRATVAALPSILSR